MSKRSNQAKTNIHCSKRKPRRRKASYSDTLYEELCKTSIWRDMNRNPDDYVV